jgi:uncharacterized protein YcbX
MSPAPEAELSRALGRAVRLTSVRTEGATMERLTPPVEEGAGTMTRSTLGGDTFVDFAPIHLISTATLEALSADARRFRPNVVVRMATPFEESAWQGRVLSLGADVRLQVITPTPRCVVPTLAHDADLPADPELLRTLARLNRVQVLDLGVRTCAGAYASVVEPGRVRVGDAVRLC